MHHLVFCGFCVAVLLFAAFEVGRDAYKEYKTTGFVTAVDQTFFCGMILLFAVLMTCIGFMVYYSPSYAH